MIDLLFYCIIVIAIIQGFRKGLVMALFALLCTLVGLAAAVKLSAVVAARFAQQPGVSGKWLPVISFVAVFLAVVLLVRLIGKGLETILKLALLGWLNRLAGIVLFLILYLAIYSMILYYGNGMHLISAENIAASRYYAWVEPFGPRVLGWIVSVIPFGKDMFAALESFFGRVGASLH